jgi:flagellar biosynthesis protein FliR
MQAAAVPSFDVVAPGSAAALVLVGARLGGLVLIAPVFSARTISVSLRTAIVVLLAVLLQPVARSANGVVLALTPVALIGETLIGFTIGMGTAVLVGAAESAGEFLAIQIGLSGAAIINPLDNTQGPALGQFMHLFAVSILLSFNAHLVMLDALAASLTRLPVGGAVDLQAGLGALVGLGSTLFALGLKFAAPVIAAVLIANVALAVLSRAAPQLNILSLAFPVQIGMGLFALAASLPFIATWFGGWETAYDAILTRTLGAFAAAGGGIR